MSNEPRQAQEATTRPMERIMTKLNMMYLTLAVAFAMWACTAQAQLTVSPQTDLQELARAITGPGVQIADPVIHCHTSGFGEFTYTGSVLGGVTDGVLLTTGTINNAIGPNNVENRTFEQGTPGNALLNTVTGRTTYDACHFEFDVIPGGDTLRFNFSFGSEEYNEWVGSQYNDVFGFFISGPGIAGDPGIGAEKNIALIPNTTQAVTINNVNNNSNSGYFLHNAGGSQIQYDGITQGLQAVAVVQPCQTYRLKLIVADASDRKFDSGVFIERIQSNAVTMESFTASAFNNIVEGCNAGMVRFTRQVITPDPLEVPYFLNGTATNGVDYPLIGDADPSVAKIAIIPGGASSVEVVFDAYADGVPEGVENIRVYLGSSTCPGFYLDSLDLMIQDSLFATVSPPTTICPGSSTQLLASGGVTYSWSPGTALNNNSIPNPTASPTSTTNYTVTVGAGSCTSSLNTSVSVSGMTLSANVLPPLCQGQGNGAVNLSVTGGTAPYSFVWTGPNGYNATTEDLANVGTGTYTVQVTDATGCTRVQSFNVNTPAALAINVVPSILPYGQNIACSGGQNGTLDLTVSGGSAPYTYGWSGPGGFTAFTQDLAGLGAGTYTVLVTDANGCTASTDRTLVEPPALTPVMSNVTNVNCHGGADGAATATAIGGIPPYSYAWNTSPAQSVATVSGLGAGTWTCTVTDGYGCTAPGQVVITEPLVAMTVSLTNVNNVFQCQGQQNPHGTATAVVVGGTGPYEYHWNTVPAQTTAVGNFNAGGTYTVTVADANGCSTSTQVTVSQPGTPSITVVQQTNLNCAGDGGSATVQVSGGSAIQSVVWNTVPPQSGATATGLPAGTWTATALHADGCQSIATVVITGAAAVMSATITNTTDELCLGDGNGSATVSISGGTAPYSYSWNTTPVQVGATATGLPAGEWMVTATDANGCSTTTTATINGPATALAVSITGFTNVLCFETEQGTAQSLATGGTQPYTYSWNSVPAQTGPNATELPAGPWIVTVTDANGCVASTSVTIGEPQFGVDAYFEEVTHVGCFGDNTGSATVVVSGGSNSFTVTWDTQPPIVGFTATGLAPGLYTVEVIDNNGCDTPKFYDVTIEGPDSPVIVDLIVTQPTCSYSINAGISLQISGGEMPYTHSWSDAFGNTTGQQDLTGLDPGTYDLLVWDAHGCTIDTSVTIVAPAPIVMQGIVTTASCQGSSNGSVTMSQTGAVQPFSIFWTGPNGYSANTFIINNLAAGVYTAYITDANGCAGMQAFDVSEPGLFSDDVVISSYTGGWNVSCASASDGSISATVTGGTGALSYAWTGPNGFTATGQDLTNIGPGTYHLTATDENGCSHLVSHVIAAPAPLTVTLSSSVSGGHHISCSGAEDGVINATIAGGTAPYITSWSGPNGFTSSQEDLSNVGPGTYTLTTTDANGCVRTAVITLTEPAPLLTSATHSTAPGGEAIACHGASTGSIDLTVSGGVQPYTVAWSGPSGFSANTQDLFNLPAGSYTVLITDGNGCTTGTTVILDQPDVLDIALGTTSHNGEDLSCSGASDGGITASVSGGSGIHSLSWTGPNGYASTATALTDLPPGTYTVVVTDGNGCTGTANITLEAPLPIDATALLSDFNGQGVSCPGAVDGSIELLLTGGTAPFDIAWVGPDGFVSNAAVLNGLGAGLYTATIIDANGCVLFTSSTITTSYPLALDLVPSLYTGGSNVSCSGTSDGGVDLMINGGTGPFSIVWTDGLGFNSTDEDIDQVGAGAYQVTVTDANGCEATDLITLISPQPLGINATLSNNNGNNVSCATGSDGNIAITVEGGTAPYAYAWDTGGTNADLTGVGAGTYTLTVTDTNGCEALSSYTLTAPEPINTDLITAILPGGFSVSCHNAADGSIGTAITGGIAPYTTTWSGPNGYTSTTTSISGLMAGTYTLEITDANGCTELHTVELTAPTPVSVALDAATWNGDHNITCAGESDGQINATVSGGLPGYAYTWSGPGGFTSTDVTISGVMAGEYQLIATDANGCDAIATIILSEPAVLDLQATLSDIGAGYQVSCAGDDGAISLNVTGGTQEYSFNWTGPDGFGSMDQNINGLGAGIYHVVVSDANGCIFETNYQLQEPVPLEVAFTATSNTCPGDDTGALGTTISGGAQPYVLIWNGPNGFTSNSEDLTGLIAGTYSVSISDAVGCTGTFDHVLVGPSPLTSGTYVSFYGQYNLQCVGDSTGVIELAPQGGTAPFTVLTTGPAGYSAPGNDHTGLVAGDYMVNLVDANGCVMDTTITLTQPDQVISTTLDVSLFPSGTNISCHGASDGWISATVTGGVGPYTFFWRGPDSTEWTTPTITGLAAGQYAYELVVTDANECSFFTDVVLTQPDSALSAVLIVSEYNDGYNVSCDGATNGSIDLTASGGNGGFTYTWTGPGGFTASGTQLTDLVAGNYEVTITDMNGCELVEGVTLMAPDPLANDLNAFSFPGGGGISCHGADDGSISADITGGSPIYSLVWNGPDGFNSTDNDLTGLSPGTYCLNVTDANGCEAESCATITEPDVLAASTSAQNADCGQSIGAVQLQVNGGSAPYAFAWGNGATTQNITGLDPGLFNVTVTDANGCIVTAQATIIGTPAVTAQGSTTDNLCHGGEEGAIDLEVLSGVAPFAYAWSTGATSQDVNGLAAGNHSVTVTDVNGCTYTDTYVVQQNNAIVIDTTLSNYAGGYNISTWQGSNGNISTEVSGGTAPYTYLWSTGSTTSFLIGIPAGWYTLTVTDANGCTTDLMVELTQPEDLEMPTGFSPNGDGANDNFIIRGLDAYPANTFVIVNRWGNVVYDRLNYRNDWNGENAQGQPLPDGTYFAILKVNNGERTLQGYVDLRR